MNHATNPKFACHPRGRTFPVNDDIPGQPLKLTMVYLDGHRGGGYGIHYSDSDIARAAVGRRRGVVLWRRVDAEGRHEFRSVNVQSGELALDRRLILRCWRADDIAVAVRLLFPRVWCYAGRHIINCFSTAAGPQRLTGINPGY